MGVGTWGGKFSNCRFGVGNRVSSNLSAGQYGLERRRSRTGCSGLLLPYLVIFQMSCTIQHSFHRVSSELLPRSVNVFIPIVCMMSANSGSTVPILRLWKYRPRSESNLSFIRRVALVMLVRVPMSVLASRRTLAEGFRK